MISIILKFQNIQFSKFIFVLDTRDYIPTGIVITNYIPGYRVSMVQTTTISNEEKFLKDFLVQIYKPKDFLEILKWMVQNLYAILKKRFFTHTSPYCSTEEIVRQDYEALASESLENILLLQMYLYTSSM